MGKQVIIGIVLLGVGLGGGFGIGHLRTQGLLVESQTQIDDLTAERDKAKAVSDETLKNAGLKITDANAKVRKALGNENRLKSENQSLKQKNKDITAMLAQVMGQKDGSTPAATPAATRSGRTAARPTATRSATSPRPSASSGRTAPIATREYVIQDGDSLWKIAANELDNGMRYKEILELNPPMTEKSKLVIGMKLKLPAK